MGGRGRIGKKNVLQLKPLLKLCLINKEKMLILMIVLVPLAVDMIMTGGAICGII